MRHLPALIWALLAAVLLLSPVDVSLEPSFWSRLDKPAHALVFAVQCWLLARSLREPGAPARGLVAAALLTALYSVVLELLQLWIPGRFWDWRDLLAGFAGIGFVALWVRRRARLRGTS